MYRKAAGLFACGLLVACAPAAPPANPPPTAAQVPNAVAEAPPAPPSGPQTIVIARLSCAQLVSAAPDDRAAGSMFYLGYAAARRGLRTLNVSEVEGLESDALGYCAAHPEQTAASAYATILAHR